MGVGTRCSGPGDVGCVQVDSATPVPVLVWRSILKLSVKVRVSVVSVPGVETVRLTWGVTGVHEGFLGVDSGFHCPIGTT